MNSAGGLRLRPIRFTGFRPPHCGLTISRRTRNRDITDASGILLSIKLFIYQNSCIRLYKLACFKVKNPFRLQSQIERRIFARVQQGAHNSGENVMKKIAILAITAASLMSAPSAFAKGLNVGLGVGVNVGVGGLLGKHGLVGGLLRNGLLVNVGAGVGVGGRGGGCGC
jgi:hypothetical protein